MALQECGHEASHDPDLFSWSQSQASDRLEAKRDIMLVHDERLVEHEEGKRAPHPERPDRITAVVARLMATGLAGELNVV